MKTRKGAARGRKTSRLKVKKETVKDLDAREQGRGVKAGLVIRTVGCTETCITCTCITCPICPFKG